MSQKTGIEWTDATWNPIRGCSKVSAGCSHCYAETVAARFSGPGQPYHGLVDAKGKWNGSVQLVSKHLDDPIRWKRPRRIFVNSMSDLFHDALRDDQIHDVFQVMAHAKHHTFQVLTKRPERMKDWARRFGRVLPNVWLGVSVEDQKAANERIPHLLDTPAAVRFLSCEPLLGEVDLRRWLNVCPVKSSILDARTGEMHDRGWSWEKNNMRGTDWAGTGLHWVIAGGESGHGARPMEIGWARTLRDQCQAAGVAFFFKQWGEWAPSAMAPEDRQVRVGKKSAGRVLDGRTHDDFPEVA